MKNNPVQFTDHALERAEQIGLTQKEARLLFTQSKQERLGLKHHFYKLIKYGNAYRNFEYFLHRGRRILFTVQHHRKELVVITVTKK